MLLIAKKDWYLKLEILVLYMCFFFSWLFLKETFLFFFPKRLLIQYSPELCIVCKNEIKTNQNKSKLQKKEQKWLSLGPCRCLFLNCLFSDQLVYLKSIVCISVVSLLFLFPLLPFLFVFGSQYTFVDPWIFSWISDSFAWDGEGWKTTLEMEAAGFAGRRYDLAAHPMAHPVRFLGGGKGGPAPGAVAS